MANCRMSIGRKSVWVLFVVSGLLVAPPLADAQQAERVYRIGYLAVPRPTPQADALDPFLQELRNLGYTEGKNLVIERRYSEGKNERLPDLADELLQRHVDVLVTFASLATEAARQRTKTTPIVMISVADPIGAGFIASFAKPGGNITGVSNQIGDLEGKALQLLIDVRPRLSRLAVLFNPDDRGSALSVPAMEEVARPLTVEVQPVAVRHPGELNAAFATLTRKTPDALRVSPTFLFFPDPDRIRIAEFALLHRIPTITAGKRFVEQGLLMSHAPKYSDLFGRAATHVDKVLRGANPADLPVEQPTTFELVINLKTAKALGLTIPQSVLLRADDVIQ
jgi:putative ABC transport system substrate-binding protein